jgi:hypothetical protein
MNTFLARSWFVSLALVAAACGGNASGSSYKGKDAACQDQCDELARCDKTVDVKACAKSCSESQLTSKGGQELLADCTAGRTCGAAGDDVVECLVDGLKDLPTSETGKKFCNQALELPAKCGGEGAEVEPSEADRAACSDSVSLLSDEALEDIGECFDKGCEAMQTCLLGKLLSFQADLGGNVIGTDLSQQLGELFGSIELPTN